MTRVDPREAAIEERRRLGVGAMHLEEGPRQMRAETPAQPRSGHGMPLVAHAAGVEAQWEGLARRLPRRRPLRRDEARLAVRRIKAALGKEPPFVIASLHPL